MAISLLITHTLPRSVPRFPHYTSAFVNLALEYEWNGCRSNRQGYARQCSDCAVQTLRSLHHGCSPQIRECMGARENFAARKLIFVTTSTCTPAKPSTRAKLAAHAAGSTMIDGSRLLTVITAC